ncbi:MAG: hypothetical protein ABIA74_02510 [bacterium]
MKKITFFTYCLHLVLVVLFCNSLLLSQKDGLQKMVEQKPSQLIQQLNEIRGLYFVSPSKAFKVKKKLEKKYAKGKVSEKKAIETLEKLFSSLSSKDKFDIGIQIFKENDKSSFVTQERILDDVSFRDLSIFYGNPTYPENN